MPNESILTSVKKVLGIPEEYEVFDLDLLMHINSAFARLNQLGVGPALTFQIEDKTSTWDEFLQGNNDLSPAKTYVSLKAKLIFDPPQTSFTQESIKQMIDQLEWTLNVAAETPGIHTPVSPIDVAAAVEDYLEDHPVVADEPLLEEHLADTTPHPVYDDLVDGEFVADLENGMA